MHFSQFRVRHPYKDDILKQVFIYNQMPQKDDFQTERKFIFDTIVRQLTGIRPDTLFIGGGDYVFFLQKFRQLYGLRSEEARVFMSLFLNLAFGKIQMSLQTKIYLMKVIIHLFEEDIMIDGLNVDNMVFLNEFKTFVKQNHLYQNKFLESYISQFSYVVVNICQHGQDIMKQVFQFAVEKREITYIALFIECVKRQNAEMLLRELFEPNGFWDNDHNWFFIIAKLIKKFPDLDYARVYPTIFLNVIKLVSQTLTSSTPQQSTFLEEQSANGIPAIVSSVSRIIVGLIVPSTKPNYNQIWMYIERIMHMILSPLSPTSSHPGSLAMVMFVESFIKFFVKRSKDEKYVWEYRINDDAINNVQVQAEFSAAQAENHLDKFCYEKFDKIVKIVIQKYMYIEVNQLSEVQNSMYVLVYFRPQYLTLILNQIQYVLNRNEEFMITTPVSILSVLLQYSIVTQPQKIDNIIDIVRTLLEILDKKGVNDNLFIFELILKMFIYFPRNKASLDSIKDQLLDLIIDNIDVLSTLYSSSGAEQSELYIDMNNLFNPLFFSLDQNQLNKFKERLVYHVLGGVKKHPQAYEKLLMIYSYMDPTFPDLIVQKVLKIMLKEQVSPRYHFLQETPFVLQTENKESLLWYRSVLQCTLQYNPRAIVKYWTKLQQLISSMMKNQSKQIFQCAYEMMFNIVINLTQKILPVRNFQDQNNSCYQTLKLDWQKPSTEAIQLVHKIIQKYVKNAMNFLRERYQDKWNKKFSSKELIDGILLHLSTNEHVTEQRKLLQKVLLIMESVVSAVLPYLKVKEIKEARSLQKFRSEDYLQGLYTLSDEIIRFLEDLLHISHTFGFLSDLEYSKIFYRFYSDMHGNLFISEILAPAEATIKKLRSTAQTRSANVSCSQYVIIAEVIYAYFLRMDFFNILLPFHRLYPLYLQNTFVFSNQQLIKNNERVIDPYFPENYHQKHRKLLQIWHQNLDISNPSSYIACAKDQSLSKNKKEGYEKAVFELVVKLKKLSEYLNVSCCVQDPETHRLIFEISKSYVHLTNKKDRVLLLSHFFSMFTIQVQFDSIMKQQGQQQRLMNLFERENRMSVIKSDLYDETLKNCKAENTQIVNDSEKIKASNEKMKEEIKKIIREAIVLLSKGQNQQKYLCLISLFMVIYSKFLSSDDPLLVQIFLTAEKTSKSYVRPIQKMGRVGIFHLINRIQRQNFKIYQVDNVVQKTNYEIFLSERNFNKPKEKSVESTFCNKYRYMYFNYPKIQGGEEVLLTHKEKLLPIQQAILEFTTDYQRVRSWYQSCLTDEEFTKTQDSDQLIDCCQPIINYMLDKDPLKINIFGDLNDAFQLYSQNFYYRFTKKICQLSGKVAIDVLQKVAQYFRNKGEDEYQMMYSNIGSGILKRSSQQFTNIYLQSVANCNNEIFVYHLSGLYQIFKQNPYTIKEIYSKIIDKLRKEKGIGRFRHIEIWKIFVLNQGRWARDQAIDGFKHLLKGIDESSVETADAIVSCIVECFTVTINLQLMTHKIPDTVSELVAQKKLFKINDKVGFEINPMLKKMIALINEKMEEQKGYQSQNMKIYTKTATKIFDSLFVYKFNDYFYDILETIIKHIIEKPIEDASELEVIRRLGEGDFPYNIYKKLKIFLEDLTNKSPIIVRKKLKLLEAIMFNKGFSTNDIQIPNIFYDVKNITINNVVAASNIFKAMTPQQLEKKALGLIQASGQEKYPLLMSLIMASGNMLYQWKEEALKTVVKWNMKKLVKDFVSTWWKGKGEGNEGQESLAMLVRNVGNPYNYLA